MDAINFLKALDENELPTNKIIEKAVQYPDLLMQLAEIERQSEIVDDPSIDSCALM